MTPEENLQTRLLAAREARAALIARLCRQLSPPRAALVVLSLNTPGPDKNPPTLDPVFASARSALLGALGNALLVEEGRDAVGPWAAVVCREAPPAVKARVVALEERLPAGRLLDLDVFGADGRQVSRAALGLAARRCFVCEEPAVDCMRLQRHPPADVAAAVERLARQARVEAGGHPCPPERLAAALVAAARRELDITPKPGLVDRRDNGSHTDLSYDLMTRSIDLLPRYYGELLHLAAGRDGNDVDPRPESDFDLDLDRCIAAGRRAEARMTAAVGSNAHRGYIFLSGLVLLASATHTRAGRSSLRQAIARLAALVLAPGRRGGPVTTHGASLRSATGIGGIEAEALAGLPSVFDNGLPALVHAAAAGDSRDRADRRLMATLMTVVEDTTALHRCGPAGLERLHRDGRHLLSLLDTGDDGLATLQQLNDDYRSVGLTMGGVADCMALTLALQETLGEEP